MSWKKVTLEDVTTKIGDGLHGTPKYDDSGEFYFINGNNLADGKIVIKEDTKRISSIEYDKIKKRLNDKTVLVAINGTLGNIGLYNDEPVALGKSACYINVNEKAERLFVRYALENQDFQIYARDFATGATIKNLGLKAVRDYSFILPPLPTQLKIACILSAYDSLIENNLKRINLLEEKAFLTYKGIVKSEKMQKISVFDYAEIMSGGTPSTTNPNYWEGEIPFFTPKDLSSQASYYLVDTERKITELGLEKCNSRLFPRDTIFITARGTVGKLVLAKIPSAISQSNYAITSRNGSSNYFLFLALFDKIDHFKQLAVGGVFDTIVVDTFKMIFIELPNEVIINHFNNDIKPIFQLIDTLQKQNIKLREARNILLPRLMSGEIEV